METKHYYHLFANGDDAENFITTEKEFKTAFNRMALCAALSGSEVLSFSIEDSHPHALLHGTYEKADAFKGSYESISKRCIVGQRGSLDGVNLHCELYEVADEQYLMNVAAYTIVQATKDGKSVMPYDYQYGTGALYFRSRHSVLPWLIDDNGNVCNPIRFGCLTKREKMSLLGSHSEIPSDWLVCNGFVLPTNYVDIRHFERIFKTHNCFRAFLSSGKSKDAEIMQKMSEVRGVQFDDLEARRLCHQICREDFGVLSTRTLDTGQRLELAQKLRSRFRISYRQLEALVHIPESELRKYVR